MSDPRQKEALRSAHLRVARPTDRIEEVVAFYSNALGFEVLGQFKDHDGFDGIMLGHEGTGYHLEFTTKRGHISRPAPSQEQLLVFYLPDAPTWRAAVHRVESLGRSSVASFNPDWDRNGRTYEDPDSYRVVIQNAAWSTD